MQVYDRRRDSMDDVFFSVIIPVYNVGDYLRECVQSVLSQDFASYEIILEDDGSTDGSGQLCDALALTDGRIRVLHQENQGLSCARNNGLGLAKGKYVLFLDSDDFYPQKTILTALQAQSNDSDIVCFNYARYTDRLLPPLISFPSIPSTTVADIRSALIAGNAYISSAWSKAVRRSLLTENQIDFEAGVYSEDIEWSAKVLLLSNSISIAPECVYAYRVRQQSITHTLSTKHIRDQHRTISRLSAYVLPDDASLRSDFYSYVAFQYCALLINIQLCRPRPARETIQAVRQLSWLLQHDGNRIVKLIHSVYRILGFHLTSWLLVVYFKFFGK